MEETHSGKTNAEATSHGGGHGTGDGDATSHILDKVLFGFDAKTGQCIWKPYGDHHGAAIVGYAPKIVGPFKLEFTKHMADVIVVAAILFVTAILVARRVLAGLTADHAPRGPLANAFEAVIVFIRDEIVIPVGGHHLGHYTPLFITYFLFILIANLIGMIPEAGSATGNFSVTLGLAGSIYALLWILGTLNQGLVHYIFNLVPAGTPFWLWPLMFVLELVGPIIKCFVLCVRLFANMIAGHLIIGSVLTLAAFGGALTTGLTALMLCLGVPLTLGIMLLEVLVCFLQAYVFTMLAVVFIGAAVHPEH
ncbi:MAG: F0F1 ATP synthase subunit A [Planctomycetota bacterium]